MQIITGFHAIEELLRSVEAQLEKKNSATKSSALRLKILYAKQGPRVKKILAQAEKLFVAIERRTDAELDKLTAPLPEYLQNHRGIILIDERPQERRSFPPMRCSPRLLPVKKPLSSSLIQLPTLTIPAPLSAAPINSPLTPLCCPNGDPPETFRPSVRSAQGRRRGCRFYTRQIW